MTGSKQPTDEKTAAPCEGADRCPLCRILWPSSGVGKLIVLVVLLVAVASAGSVYLFRPDVDRELARYDALKRAGRDDEAAKVLDKVIRAGIELYEGKRFKESIRVFEKVIEREPKKPLVLNYLGLMVGGLGDEEKAIGYFKKAIEVDPLSPQPYWNLAHIDFFVKKDYPACEKQLRKAMRYAVLKAQYRLLYALCAVERKLDERVIIDRLKDTVRVAVNQANSVRPEDLRPGSSLSKVLAEAAKRLASYGDEFGYKRLERLATEARTEEVRAFAERLLAGRGRRR